MTDIELSGKQGASENNQSTQVHNRETLERMKTKPMMSKTDNQGTKCQINQGNGIECSGPRKTISMMQRKMRKASGTECLSPRKAVSKMQRKVSKVTGYLGKPTTWMAKMTRNGKCFLTVGSQSAQYR